MPRKHSTETPRKVALLSPQISRIFTEGFKKFGMMMLAAVIIALLTVNLFFSGKEAYDLAKEQAQLYPQNPQPHLLLATFYQQNNDLDRAETELKLAVRDRGLGASSIADNELRKIQQLRVQPGEMETEIIRWEKTVAKYSGYRDGYLKLAYLNWKLYRNKLAKSYWEKAFFLDPNNETVRRIGELVNK